MAPFASFTPESDHHPQQSLLPRTRRSLLLTCGVSLLFIGFYVSYLSIPWSRRLGGDTNGQYVGTTSRRKPSCPIPNDADVCIHHSANLTHIVDLCGPLRASVGHCQDRVYEMLVITRERLEETSNYARLMIVQGDNMGVELDQFVQTRSHWMIDTIGGQGYELLISVKDKERLALQQELDLLQTRCDRFFYGTFHSGDLESSWHNLDLGLAYGLRYNMTLFPPVEYKHFIRIHTCTEAQLAQSLHTHPPETDFDKWDKSTVNFKSLDADVSLLARRPFKMMLPKYKRRGYFWWRSMLTFYAIRPNAHLRKLIRGIGTKMTTPSCISIIHMQHTDNSTEAEDLIDFSDSMDHAERYRAKTGVSTVYVMTDDPDVIESTKDYPDFQFHYMNVERSNKGWTTDMQNGVSRDMQERDFAIDLFTAAQCQHLIVRYSSPVGRLVAEMAYAMRNQEPDAVSLDLHWIMDP
ncbi:hypothetical protein EDD11_006035 [Mortierella claussenii]|nr:hypothetical protein EDD11_006035 [Mortierella claussenii]